MQRRNKSQIGSRFQRSVHLERDHGREESLNGYIVTACARRASSRLVGALAGDSAIRAWTITGPYGTGKSSFSLFLSSALTPLSFPQSKKALAVLDGTDKTLADHVRTTIAKSGGLVPVLITGTREPLTVAIVRGLSGLIGSYRSIEARRLQSKLTKTTAIGDGQLITLVEEATSVIRKAAQGVSGILLVIDELGKLLEFAAANPLASDVYALQRLAEYAGRAQNRLCIVGVLHQDFTGYARNLAAAERVEWEKVRGRFEDIVFEDSADELLRLVTQAWGECAGKEARLSSGGCRNFQSLCNLPWDLGIAPTALSRREGPQLLAKCFPLHPCLSLLLGPIFKRYGQNERSAFSFLSSHEPHSLLDFSRRTSAELLYGIPEIYSYLRSCMGDGLVSNRDGKRWAEAFDIEARHPSSSENELSVLRTIALLGIVGRWHGVAPTRDVIRFALSPRLKASAVDDVISKLQARSAIVFRRFNETYNLWEGSDVDIEGMVSAARADLPATIATSDLLNRHYSPRPFVARRHSFTKGTLRYFEICYSSPESLPNQIAAIDKSRADGHIIVVLISPTGKEAGRIEREVQAHAARPDLLVVVPSNCRQVETLARELACLASVRQNTPELDHDATAKRELQSREAEAHRRLEDELAKLFVPGSGRERSRWYHQGQSVPVDHLRDLNELLSKICDDHFALTPVIINEIINRRDLSSSAAAARRNLIERMVDHGSIEELGIEGNPPERSIYLSVLKQLRIHYRSANRWVFASSASRVREDARPLWKEMSRFFDSAHSEPRSIGRLFDILRRPPYGIRDGVLPILICAALQGNEADVALYEAGAFMPQMTVAAFERLMKDPESFVVRQWRVTGVRATVFEHLAELLGHSQLGERVERRDVLDVVKPLMRFARKLDAFTQRTKSLSPEAVAVRDALLTASEPDELLFAALPEACGIDPFGCDRKPRRSDTEAFLVTFRKALRELQTAYENLLRSVVEAVSEALGGPQDVSRIREALMDRARLLRELALDADVKVFVSRVGDTGPEERIWAESIASFLSNKHPSLWVDEDRSRFGVRLQQLARSFRSLETLVTTPDDSGTRESIRVSIVGTRMSSADRVLHLDDGDNTRVEGMRRKIGRAIGHSSLNGNRDVALAALARVTHQLLVEESLGFPETA